MEKKISGWYKTDPHNNEGIIFGLFLFDKNNIYTEDVKYVCNGTSRKIYFISKTNKRFKIQGQKFNYGIQKNEIKNFLCVCDGCLYILPLNKKLLFSKYFTRINT